MPETSSEPAVGGGFALDAATLERYLQRVRWPGSPSDLASDVRAAPRATLAALLECHCLAVPFENLDQHAHPAAAPGYPAIARHNVWEHPTRVGVARSVQKLVDYERGGFCFEGNIAFCWLLRQFYGDVRLSLAQSYNPSNPESWNVPSHVVLLVRPDTLSTSCTAPQPTPGADRSAWEASRQADLAGMGADEFFLMDPFWGDTPRTVLSLRPDVTGRCRIGDEWRVRSTTSGDADATWGADAGGAPGSRFSHVLLRRRVRGVNARGDFTGTEFVTESQGEAAQWEPQYRFAIGDALPYDDADFQTGFEFVLTDSTSWFTQGAIITMSAPGGYKTLTKSRLKRTTDGQAAYTPVESEAQWRELLKVEYGVVLTAQREYEGATAAMAVHAPRL